jgi:tryptophan synthase alpha chain
VSAPSSQGKTVVMNLSGRGDKDVAQMMEILDERVRVRRPPPCRAARDGSCVQRRERRTKSLVVPYLTGGLPGWLDMVRAAAAPAPTRSRSAFPFSDPVMDGPVIQEASEPALAGATPPSVLAEIANARRRRPVAVMTYYNLVYRFGLERFARLRPNPACRAAILPDLPLEESGEWCAAADAAGIETVMLAAPTAPDERLAAVCDRARGFVYGVGLAGYHR